MPAIALKHFLRRTAGYVEIVEQRLRSSNNKPQACIFYYHRVSDIPFRDRRLDDRNVTPALLESHIAALAESCEIVPLTEIKSRFATGLSPKRPIVSLTFDDGYANFRHSVLPILERYGVPAMLSVVTSYVGSLSPAPFDRWARTNHARAPLDAWKMASWDDLEACIRSGLVTIGAHSHAHVRAAGYSAEKLHDEAFTSGRILRERFGDKHGRLYAYPFGNSLLGHVSDDYEQAVRSAGFQLAVTTDVGLVTPETGRFRMPRLEAHSQDTPEMLMARCSGAISPLYLKNLVHRIAAALNRNHRAPAAPAKPRSNKEENAVC